MRARARARRTSAAALALGADDPTLLDLVDNVLSKGVVLTGDISLGLADVELVYLRLSVLLCAADRVLPSEPSAFDTHHHRRRLVRRPRRGTPA